MGYKNVFCVLFFINVKFSYCFLYFDVKKFDLWWNRCIELSLLFLYLLVIERSGILIVLRGLGNEIGYVCYICI